MALHDVLYKAMKGFGTDEAAIYGAAEKVTTQEQWWDVQNAFKKAHADMHKGDLLKAMKDELSGGEEKKVRDILAKNGVDWEKKQEAAQPARKSPSTSSLPAGRQPSGKDQKLSEVLYKAMKGFGTDEAAIYGAAEKVKTQEQWWGVQDDFKKSHSDMHKGDLLKAMKDELTGGEEKKVRDILAKNGIDWEKKRPAGGGRRDSNAQQSASGDAPGGNSAAQKLLDDAERRGPDPLTFTVNVSGEIYGCKENLAMKFPEQPYLGELRSQAASGLQREATRQCPPGEVEQHVVISSLLIVGGQGWGDLISSDQLYDGCQVYARQDCDRSAAGNLPAPSPPRSRYVVPGASPAGGPPMHPPPPPPGAQFGGYSSAPAGGPPTGYGAGAPTGSTGYTAATGASYPPPPGHPAAAAPCSPQRAAAQRQYEDARRRADAARGYVAAAESEEAQAWRELQRSPP